MKTLTFWKGLAIVAVLFLFAGLEAAAQLPVRTQQVQMINGAGGTITFDANDGVGATVTTSYTVSWPLNPPAGVIATDEAILIGTWNNGTDVDLRWEISDGFVDGNGATNHVTYWSPDGNTLHAQENFEFNPGSGLLGIGVNNTASVVGETPAAGTAGSVEIGDGTDAEIFFDGTAGSGEFGVNGSAGLVTVSNASAAEITLTASTATVDVGVNSAGTVNVTDGTTNSVVLNGTAGSATVGHATLAGSVVFHDGNGQTATVNTGDHVANIALSYNATLAGAPAAGFLPIATNQLTATEVDYLLVANADGTATWEANPLANLQMEREALPAGAYTHTVAFPAAFVAPVVATDVVVTANILSTSANIVQVTDVTLAGFTLQSTAPFTAGDEVMYVAVPQ